MLPNLDRPGRRLIQVQLRLRQMLGHRFNETVRLGAEARRRGLESTVFLNADARPEVASATGGSAVLDDPVFRPGLSFDERTCQVVQQLRQVVSPLVRRDDLVLTTGSTQAEARAFAAWLRDLPARQQPWVVALFVLDRWNWAAPGERAEFATLARELRELPPETARRLIVCAQPSGLADELAALLGVGVGAAPWPALDDQRSAPGAPRSQDGLFRVATLGPLRPEKGSRLLGAIMRACAQVAPVSFVFQLANEGIGPDEVADLARTAAELGATALPGALGREAYGRALADADLVLLPYVARTYRRRGSGIFSEAAAAGKPLVVTDGTWMAEQLRAGLAAGEVFAELTPWSVATAVCRAIRRYPELLARAAALAPAWRSGHSAAAFLDWVEREIARRQG